MSSSGRMITSVIVIVFVIIGVGFVFGFILMNQTPTTTSTITSTSMTGTTPTGTTTTSVPSTSWPTSTTFTNTTPTTTTPARTLTIMTRFDVSVQSIFGPAFLASDFAISHHITDIIWKSPAVDFWDDLILAGQTDLCWGGGEILFNQLVDDGYLIPLVGPEIDDIINRVNQNAMGTLLLHYDNEDLMWIGSSISSFGFTLNQEFLDTYSLSTPLNWTDLRNVSYGSFLPAFATIAMANAPNSMSNLQIYQIILQSQGWNEGWDLLSRMAGNSRIYGGSVETQMACENGDVGVSMSIDFYGYLSQLNNPDCQYIIPSDGAYLESQPLAIVNTSSNADLAMGFIDFVMSPQGQSLFLDNSIRHLPAMVEAFQEPLGLAAPDMYLAYNETVEKVNLDFNNTLAEEMQMSVAYYFESVLTNAHDELVNCWSALIDAYLGMDINKSEFEYFVQLMSEPVSIIDPHTTQDETFDLQYAISINNDLIYDDTYRGQVMTSWTNAAKLQYNEVYQLLQDYIS